MAKLAQASQGQVQTIWGLLVLSSLTHACFYTHTDVDSLWVLMNLSFIPTCSSFGAYGGHLGGLQVLHMDFQFCSLHCSDFGEEIQIVQCCHC